MTVSDLLAQLAPLGRGEDGGYHRHGLTPVDRELRGWFTDQAEARGLAVRSDSAGNQWAWWNEELPGPVVVVGSHLDSVPGGGAYDGPLGVCSAFAAFDRLRDGVMARRPLAIASFMEEEGSRFGLACLGSRLLTGKVAPAKASALLDDAGTTLVDAWREFKLPGRPQSDPALTERIGVYVELHVEQGVALADLDAAVGSCSGIWPHGRWRVTFSGQGNHAGTTPLDRRDDPMLPLARLITEARAAAQRHGALATVGKVVVTPNGANAIASRVEAWLDVRAAAEEAIGAVLADLEWAKPVAESRTPALHFALDDWIATALDAPSVGTGAGHDAGVFQDAAIPSGMVFVRNRSGISHDPAESADEADCAAGVAALAAVLTRLLQAEVLPGRSGAWPTGPGAQSR